MELNRFTELIKKYSPAHFRDICAALSVLSDEMEYTKAALSKNLIDAQNHDDFSKAREILDVQEELSNRIADIRNLVNMCAYETVEETSENDNYDVSDKNDVDRNNIDYSQFDTDDTIAYDIESTPVTFKRPAAFSYKGKKYSVTSWKTLLVKMCELLYKENPAIINRMVNEESQAGVVRVKLSLDREDIYRPAKIAGSNIWIETNRSASDICRIIIALLKRYGISSDKVKVYFRRDYTALHTDGE